MFLLALAIDFSASELHARLALRIRREWLDRKYRPAEPEHLARSPSAHLFAMRSRGP